MIYYLMYVYNGDRKVSKVFQDRLYFQKNRTNCRLLAIPLLATKDRGSDRKKCQIGNKVERRNEQRTRRRLYRDRARRELGKLCFLVT